MYLMYVDESGDTGIVNSPTKYYILSAIVVHEKKWLHFLNETIAFRRILKSTKSLLMKEEIHASVFVTKRIKTKKGISPSNRIDILKKCIDWLSIQNYLSIITIRVDKSKPNVDPFSKAWDALIQRFENTLQYNNFPNRAFHQESGIIISDDTDVKRLTALLRKKRRVNFVPNLGAPGGRNLPMQFIVKDPICRNSMNSYMLQMVDVVAYFAKQLYDSAKVIRKKGARNYYLRLDPIICKKANRKNTLHKIIEL